MGVIWCESCVFFSLFLPLAKSCFSFSSFGDQEVMYDQDGMGWGLGLGGGVRKTGRGTGPWHGSIGRRGCILLAGWISWLPPSVSFFRGTTQWMDAILHFVDFLG